jgi:hypothetical protein
MALLGPELTSRDVRRWSTARTLNLGAPASLLAIADEVIE